MSKPAGGKETNQAAARGLCRLILMPSRTMTENAAAGKAQNHNRSSVAISEQGMPLTSQFFD